MSSVSARSGWIPSVGATGIGRRIGGVVGRFAARVAIAAGAIASTSDRWQAERRRRIGSFYGATTREEDAGFTPRSIGPNRLTADRLPTLVARTRYLSHSDPVIAPACQSIIKNVCGPDGIMLRPKTGNRQLDRRLSDLWAELADGMDADRSLSESMLQRQAVRELFEAGHFLSVIDEVPAWRGFDAGPALRIVPCEQIPMSDGVYGPVAQGQPQVPSSHQVRMGIQIDEYGRHAAYWVYREMPADGHGLMGGTGVLAAELVQIPGERATMVSTPGRANQLRGWPMPVAAVQPARDKDGLLNAVSVSSQFAARMGIHYEGYNSKEGLWGTQLTGLNGDAISDIPGALNMTVGPAGTRPHVAGKDLPNANLVGFQTMLAQHIAACCGADYADAAGDYSKQSYATSRTRDINARKGIRVLQHIVWRGTSMRLYQAAVRWWAATGKLDGIAGWQRLTPRQLIECRPILPGYESADPAKEAKADETNLALGTVTYADVCGAKGHHYEDVMDQRIDEEKMWQRKRMEAGLGPAPLFAAATAQGSAPEDDPQDAPGGGSGGDEGGDTSGEDVAGTLAAESRKAVAA